MATVQTLLTRGTQILRGAEISGSRLEAQVLLAEVMGVDRTALHTHPERLVAPEQEQRFLALLQRRTQGEPVAYLVGHKAFYGLDFLVDRRVLIPRPETELLVESALALIERYFAVGRVPVVADIGTGSGAIPITLAVEQPRLPFIYACDISSDALQVALLNSERHHVASRVRLLQGDLLTPLPEPVDLLLANLPYVGTEELDQLTPDVRDFEPHLALFSGPLGLDLLQRLCQDAKNVHAIKEGGAIVLEIGYQQREPVVHFIAQLWPQATISWKQDYAGWDRIIQVQL